MGFTWDLPYDSIDISTMWGFSGIYMGFTI